MGKKDKTTPETDTDLDAEFAEIQDQARNDYELADRLANRSRRRKKVTIYSDAEAGEELGFAVDEIEEWGVKTGRRIRRGAVGKLDALQAEGEVLLKRIEDYTENEQEVPAADAERAKQIQKESTALKRKITALKKRLDETSYVFNLQSLPEIITRDMKRQTRATLNIKGKGVPENLKEEYELEQVVQNLVASTESWTDIESGETHSKLSLPRARSFRDFLPTGQFPRLERAMVELSYEAVIAHSATDNADF